MKLGVLIVDDEPSIREALAEVMAQEDYQVMTASCGEEAVEVARQNPVDLVLLDMKLPGAMSGLDTLSILREMNHETQVVMMTAYASVGSAVEAMRMGAYDYVNKPFKIDEIRLTVRRALDTLHLRRQVAALRLREREAVNFDVLRSPDPVMREACELARRVAKSPGKTILLQGESGTGKELLARAIHNESDRADGPFMALNCTALPETLFESELFGHEKGAFTDARTKRIGLAELADGGTLFMDEIGDMALPLQAKFLRFLQERTFRRVGGGADIQVDVRVVAATNRDLETEVQTGRFRDDLFYRINVVPIYVPPLRERKADIPFLAKRFVEDFNRDFSKEVREVSPEAMERLLSYNWPGNVRELKNLIERVMILESEPIIRPDHIPIPAERSARDGEARVALPLVSLRLREVERQVILHVLDCTDGNRSAASRILGVNRTTLYSKMRKLGIYSEAE